MNHHAPTAEIPQDAIGYVRVSSNLQAERGRGLENQISTLRNWSRDNGYRVTFVYEDVASAAGPKSLSKRPEFQQAVNEALRAGVPLIVMDATRLSRDLVTLEKLVIERGLTVISVEDGGVVPAGILRQRVAAGAQVAKRIASGTREAIRRAGDTRKKASSTAGRKAAEASVKARIDRKFEVLGRVGDYLEANPALEKATSREIADKLNDAGILTGWNRPWTPGAVRGKWAAIKSELDYRREMAAQDASEGTSTIGSSVARSPTFDTALPAAGDVHAGDALRTTHITSLHRRPDVARAGAEEHEDEEAGMREQPFFDMFGTRG